MFFPRPQLDKGTNLTIPCQLLCCQISVFYPIRKSCCRAGERSTSVWQAYGGLGAVPGSDNPESVRNRSRSRYCTLTGRSKLRVLSQSGNINTTTSEKSILRLCSQAADSGVIRELLGIFSLIISPSRCSILHFVS